MRLPPGRDLLKARLLDLLAGRTTREEIADWAVEWVRDPLPDIHDWVVWEALTQLAGADLRASPTTYLHDESDFHAWLDSLELAEENRPEE